MTGVEHVPDHVAYRQVRANITGLLTDRPGAADAGVPSCPKWTVRDLVGHLLDVCGIVVGRLSGTEVPSRSAGLDINALLTEWAASGQQAERLIEAAGGERGRIGLMDAYTHELDLRYALDAPRTVDHPAYPRAVAVLVDGLSSSVIRLDLPALRVETEGAQRVVGTGEPVATVTGDPLDLYRSLAGRRTPEQIGAELTWSADPATWLPAFAWGPFHPPRQPVEHATR
jgi:uncharacterized protein (TIGR03083 family)